MPVQTQNIGTLLVELLLDASGVDKGTKEAQKKIAGFGAALDDLAKKVDQKITAAFKAAGVAMAAIGTGAVVTGAQFEKQMSKVAAVSGATQEQLAELTEEARRIGRETAFSATEAAQGMEALAQAGFTVDQIISATAEAMNLAGASGVSLDEATSLVAATLTQFSLSASEAGRVSDVFAQAAQSSLLTVEDLGIALRYAGSVGAAFGMSLEETAAAVAQFRNAGLTGEQAGTNFRGMLEALANPTKMAMEELDALGLTVEQVNPALHSFDEIMQSLSDSGMNTAQSFAIFGTVSGANVARLSQAWEGAKESTTGYQQTLEGLEAANGVAGRTFATMADNVAGRFEQLTSQVEELFLTIYDSISGPLKRLIEQLTDRVGVLASAFGDSSDDATAAMDRIVDAILAVTDAVIKLLPYLPLVATGMAAALVGSKGIQYASAAVKLAEAFGVDLAAGIGKAVTALRAMSAAQAAFSIAGVGVIVAGLGVVIATVARLAATYTGAASAARALDGQLRGAEAFAELNKVEQDRIGDLLQKTQDLVKARIASGKAVSQEERALLTYTKAQAYSAMLAGDIVELNDALGVTSQKTAGFVEVNAAAYDEQARKAAELADRLDTLQRSYEETSSSALSMAANVVVPLGLKDNFDDLTLGAEAFKFAGEGVTLMSGPLAKAREETGLQINSLEDLAEAAKKARMESEQYAQMSRNLTNVLADQTAAQREAEEAAGSRIDQSAQTQKMLKREEDAAKEAEEAARKAGKTEEDLAKAAAEHAITASGLAAAVANSEAAYDSLSAAVPEVVEALKPLQEQLAALYAMDVAQGNLENIADIAGEAINETTAILEDELGFWKLLWFSTFESLKEAAKNAWASVGAGATELLGSLSGLGAVSSLGDATDLVGLFTGAADAAATAGEDAAQAYYDGQIKKLEMLRDSGKITGEEFFNQEKALAAKRDAMAAAPDDESDAAGAAVREAAAAQVAFVQGFAEALPVMLDALIEALPALFDAVVEAIPSIVESLASHIPDLIRVLTEGLVQLLSNSGEIVAAVLTNLPAIIGALIEAAPQIAVALIEGILDSLWRIIKALGEGLLEIITLGFAKTQYDKGDKSENAKTIGRVRDTMGGKKLFGKSVSEWQDIFSIGGGSRSFSGIEYVPSTMATVLEPGEAVLDAAQNAARQRWRVQAPAEQSRPSGPGPGSSMPSKMVWAVDGRVLDEVQFEGVRRGTMPRMRRTLRKIRGGRVGFSRGRLNVWSR